MHQVELYSEAQSRKVLFRVTAPDRGGPYPLIVFSHGAMCGPGSYARITDQWAAEGYVVISPIHLDAIDDREAIMSMTPTEIIETRLFDVVYPIDQLDAIEQAADMAGVVARGKYAIAGHSFGGMIAQVIAGMRLAQPVDGEALDRSDARFVATIVMSGVGPMPSIARDGFSYLQGPLIVTGGTQDVGDVGSGEIHPWEWRMSAYALAPDGDKYALVLDQADHFLGGLICRSEVDGPEDPAALREIQTATGLFLDAHLKQSDSARAALLKLAGASDRREFAVK